MPTGPKKDKTQSEITGQLLDRGLPANEDAERFVLGSILLDASGDFYQQAAAGLVVDDFSLTTHQRIFRRMGEISDRAEKIDRMTVAAELSKHSELQSVGGLNYLISLDDGLPQVPHIDGYIRIVKDQSRLRSIIYSSQNTLNRALLGEDSPRDIIESSSDHLLSLAGGDLNDADITPFGIIQSYPGGMDQFMDPSKQEMGLPTGFTKFDEITAGLQPEDLIIIGGRPSMGKTSLALNLAEHVALKLKKRPVVFSLEMSRIQNLRRMICSYARVDYKKFRMGYMNAQETAKCITVRNWIVESKLLIDDNPVLTVASFRARMNKIIKKYGKVDLAIVDYLQLMSSTGKQENRNQEVSAQTRGMKLAAKEYGIPIVLLSQLGRAVETRKGDHRPMLSDLRESGSIEQDADMVGFVFREEIYNPHCEELKGIAELILAKSRNGETGTVKMSWLGPLMRFENYTPDVYEDHGD